MNKQVVLYPTTKFYTIINQDFRKNTRQTHTSRFLHDKILGGFNKGLMTSMILINLQKVFDMNEHDLLLKN